MRLKRYCEPDSGTRKMLQAKVATTFVLLAAAPIHAQARQEKLVPPLPIPHVAHTAAVHRPVAVSRPRARPAPIAAPVAPNKAQAPLPIYD